MHRTILKSLSFRVADGRRGKDFSDTHGFENVYMTFKNHMQEWEEFVAFVLQEFKVPLNTLEFIIVGMRNSWLGQAKRSEGWVKITPCANYDSRAIVTTLIHELGHIVTPLQHKMTYSGMRRDIHGQAFKINTYKLAKYAYAVGLLEEHEVRWDIGMSQIQAQPKAALTNPAISVSPIKFRVGDIVTWKKTGYKHGGTYTGEIVKINPKRYLIKQLTKDGIAFVGFNWRFPIGSTELKLMEA